MDGWRPTRGMARVVGCLAVLGTSMAMAACDDEEEILFVELDPIVASVVTTFVDSTYNFSMLRTFAMPDTVVHFAPLTGTPSSVSRAYDRVALDRVRQNLLARGYRQVQDPSTTTPGFVVLVGATASDNYNAWIGYPWYGVWRFYPGWGWYAPGFDDDWDIEYPWYVATTNYRRGTLIVDLIPVTMVNPLTRSIRSAWAGVATGVLDGTQTSSTVTAAIDRMFELSPYLQAGSPLTQP